MTDDPQHVREELLELLLGKLDDENFPSSTELDLVESLLTPADVHAYCELLLRKVRNEWYPSISMLRRIQGVS